MNWKSIKKFFSRSKHEDDFDVIMVEDAPGQFAWIIKDYTEEDLKRGVIWEYNGRTYLLSEV